MFQWSNRNSASGTRTFLGVEIGNLGSTGSSNDPVGHHVQRGRGLDTSQSCAVEILAKCYLTPSRSTFGSQGVKTTCVWTQKRENHTEWQLL